MAYGSAAHAQDVRPCVSKAEYNSLKGAKTQAQVEARFEVVGLGDDGGQGAYRYYVVYSLCGYDPAAASVTVSYANDSHIWQTELMAIIAGTKPTGYEAHQH